MPVSAVRGRVSDDYTVPALLGAAALVGVLMALTGLGLGIAAIAVRRRTPPVVPPQWGVRA